MFRKYDLLRAMAAFFALAAVVGVAGSFCGMRPAAAQEGAGDPTTVPSPDEGANLIVSGARHAPAGRAIRVCVFGDSLANGVWEGLKQAFSGDKAVRLVNRSKVSTGLVRDDYYDWNAELATTLMKEEFDIAVVMIGSNDRQRLRPKDGGHEFDTQEFRAVYAGRVDEFMQQLGRRGVAVYWLGLPAMRAKGYSAAMSSLNEIFQARAAANGVTFVPTQEVFSGPDGAFSANGEDISGVVRRLRAGDGVHFTRRGYRKLAALVEPAMREFLSTGPVAKGERVFVDGGRGVQPEGAGSVSMLPPPGQRGQNGQTRNGDLSASSARARAVFQATSPAYKVLTLGERVEPMPGRGDDFSWTR